MPSLFLTSTAAAGSIGFINSIGNLGGFVGPKAMGWFSKQTGSYTPGISILCGSMAIAATIILLLPLSQRTPGSSPVAEVPVEADADAVIEPR